MSTATAEAPPDVLSPDVQSILDRAARLQRRINVRKENTKELEKRLENLKAQIAEMVPSLPEAAAVASTTKGGGTSWTFGAAAGSTVRVTQPAAKLMSKIADLELIKTLRSLCREKFGKLFIVQYNCQKNFRQLAYQLLDKEIASDVIELCEEQATPSVTISS